MFDVKFNFRFWAKYLIWIFLAIQLHEFGHFVVASVAGWKPSYALMQVQFSDTNEMGWVVSNYNYRTMNFLVNIIGSSVTLVIGLGLLFYRKTKTPLYFVKYFCLFEIVGNFYLGVFAQNPGNDFFQLLSDFPDLALIFHWIIGIYTVLITTVLILIEVKRFGLRGKYVLNFL